MTSLDVRIETLAPMHVASVRMISKTPERDAWARLAAWAIPLGLLDDPQLHPVFGFNNPPPSDAHPDYGYEFWIRVDPGTATRPGIELKDFDGGLFAVTTCRLIDDPAGDVPEVWLSLWKTVQTGAYRWRKAQELERLLNPRAPDPEKLMDLYLPIRPV